MLELKKHIAAVVVLFNPNESVIQNLYSYKSQVNKIYAIDNTELKINNNVIECIKKINNLEYLSNSSNLGVAAALNIGANRAITDGYQYLLTMDQDSKATDDMVNTLVSIINSDPKVGIAAAEHFDPSFHTKNKLYNTEVLYTMTSGNLLNLKAYQMIGGFLEELFIDHIDHEYCLRLNKFGYKVVKTNQVIVYHSLGNAERRSFFGFSLYPTHHSPLRLYYRTRNRFYINNKYRKTFPDYTREDIKHMLLEIFYILFGEKNIFKKIKMMFKGYIDYRKHKLGRVE